MKPALEVKEDGLIYLIPDTDAFTPSILVSDQEKARELVMRKSSMGKGKDGFYEPTIGIHPIPDLQWEVKRTCKWHGNLDACGNETCWDLVECQNSPEKFLAILKESKES